MRTKKDADELFQLSTDHWKWDPMACWGWKSREDPNYHFRSYLTTINVPKTAINKEHHGLDLWFGPFNVRLFQVIYTPEQEYLYLPRFLNMTLQEVKDETEVLNKIEVL